MLGSILTRQYRFATRGVRLTLRTARQAIDIAGGVVDEVADRLGLQNGHDEPETFNGEVVSEAQPRPEPPEPRAAPAPAGPGKRHGDPMPASPAASAPAEAPPAAPEPPAAAQPPAAHEPPAAFEPDHVSTEAELVEEFSEPGAEDGAGAQVRIGEPWTGYRHLKASDVIARLTTATREELAAVELFELANANRKSVVAAAQRALKKSSPPRGTTDQ